MKVPFPPNVWPAVPTCGLITQPQEKGKQTAHRPAASGIFPLLPTAPISPEDEGGVRWQTWSVGDPKPHIVPEEGVPHGVEAKRSLILRGWWPRD